MNKEIKTRVKEAMLEAISKPLGLSPLAAIMRKEGLLPDIVSPVENSNNSPSEGIMPNHVKYNGKLYSLDKKSMKVMLYRYETIDLKECPEPVLRELIKMQSGLSVDLDNENPVENA